ncbi:MAG TPA: hypothetical protein VKB93_06065 [Thermoanaerobaculia bacterium]|nr:hypothetical protein [Thermoanaerobaculia bacterium]
MQRFLLLLALVACNAQPPSRENAAAEAFTRAHRKHKLQAAAAGSDCRVLLIAVETRFDNDLVESIHYGTGDYGAFGGVEQFARDHKFRAVVYRDPRGGLWTYGATTRDEARSLPRC